MSERKSDWPTQPKYQDQPGSTGNDLPLLSERLDTMRSG